MFATPKSLEKRTGKSDVDRPTYLTQLIEEYHCHETTEEKKLQVLANLGNFGYDPINYEFFRRLHVLDIFLNNIVLFYDEKSVSIKTLEFSLGSICNLCNDIKNREYLLKKGLVKYVANCLVKCHRNEDQAKQELILLNSIMILIFVCDETTIDEIMDPDIVLVINQLTFSANKTLSNLANVFIQDYYTNYNKGLN